MYNLHAHSILSDGVLLPSEIAVRYMALGYKAIAITDHVDYSNIETTVKAIIDFVKHWPKSYPLKVFPGVELTHLPCSQFKPLASFAREKGIKVIIAHGQTPVEPVLKGTNRAALEADIDILAHPGLISEADVKLASRKGVFLEVTTRKGHNKTNGHVIKSALKFGAKLILNNDSHGPEDIISQNELFKLARKSGLNKNMIKEMFREVEKFIIEKERE